MRTLLLFDQVQAGFGGKERGDTELGLEKGGVGSYLMFKEDFEKAGLTALATIYCEPSRSWVKCPESATTTEGRAFRAAAPGRVFAI